MSLRSVSKRSTFLYTLKKKDSRRMLLLIAGIILIIIGNILVNIALNADKF